MNFSFDQQGRNQKNKLDNNFDFQALFLLRRLLAGWRIIGSSCILGLFFSFINIATSTPRYEAFAYIEFPPDNLETRILGIKRPEEAMFFYRTLVRYPEDVIGTCNDDVNEEAGKSLISKVVFIKQSAPNILGVRITSRSPKVARSCVTAIANYIIDSQKNISELKMNLIKLQLTSNNNKLSQLHQNLRQAYPGSSLQYFAEIGMYINEAQKIITEIERDKHIILNFFAYMPKLLLPISEPSRSFSPNNGSVLMVGFLMGLFLGVAFILLPKVRSDKKIN